MRLSLSEGAEACLSRVEKLWFFSNILRSKSNSCWAVKRKSSCMFVSKTYKEKFNEDEEKRQMIPPSWSFRLWCHNFEKWKHSRQHIICQQCVGGELCEFPWRKPCRQFTSSSHSLRSNSTVRPNSSNSILFRFLANAKQVFLFFLLSVLLLLLSHCFLSINQSCREDERDSFQNLWFVRLSKLFDFWHFSYFSRLVDSWNF